LISASDMKQTGRLDRVPVVPAHSLV
jgi:hypothetical protein